MKKLRNKKTGEIVDGGFILIPACTGFIGNPAKSVTEINDTWEDYKPEEPRITDPEWRHVVRKWYELNDLEGKLRVRADVKNYKIIGWRKEDDVYGQEIDIPLSVMGCEIDPFGGTIYTITELCGEEEE